MEFNNKRDKKGNESGKQKSNANRSSFKKKLKGRAPSSSGTPTPTNKGEYYGNNSRVKPTYSQGRVAHGGENLIPSPSVVGTTQVLVVKAPMVVSSVFRLVISCDNVQRTSRKC